MSADNNYNEILEEVCEKLNSIDSIKELDLLDIKNSVESIENLITDTQAKLNFQEIKEKLESIAFQVDTCNETLLKDLYNDLNSLKEKSEGVGAYLENIQNVQNLALTSAEFEEYQKQQLDLALKTNENIFNELSIIKEKSLPVDNTENLKNIENQLTTLHNSLTAYIEQIIAKVETTPNIDEIGSVMSDMTSVNQKNIKQTNSLIKELEANFSNFKNKEFANQISKISEIYDSLNIIHAWIEKVGFINKSIENVYARLGSNIDFDDVSEKVDIIYENISALNNWTMKIDNVDGNMSDMQSKIASLSSCLEDTKNISNAINSIKSRLDSSFTEDLDFEDLANKMDIIYETLTTLNEWASKVDNISEQVSNINNVFEDELITSKIDLIYDNISLLNEWVSKIDGVAQRSEELDTKFTLTNDNLNIKLEELTATLSNASKIIEDVPNIKDKLETLSTELNTITRTTKNETESYIYTLLDIESDFLKLHKFMDDKTSETTQDINSLKARFEELNEDIASISKRTNKLILSADDANKEFKNHLEMFKKTILELDIKRQEFNPELKFALMGEQLSVIGKLLQNSLNAGRNLNTAFIYLAEWVDATGGILNGMQNDIADIKNQTAKEENPVNIIEELSQLKSEIANSFNKINDIEEAFSNYKNEDISEIKSLLTGIIVQLNTALTPDIDSLNERIDKLSEENTNKLSELELLMQEKINQQSKQINALEEKLEEVNNKFDKLIEAMSEEHKNYEIKDILNYIATQITATNEALNNKPDASEKIEEVISSQKTANSVINEVAEKLSSFDNNINKIVSYIEEE